MKTVALCPNPKRDVGFRCTKEALGILQGLGYSCILTFPFETELTGEELGLPVRPLKEAVQQADLLISLGGDGTILRIASDAAKHRCPILAVNVGHLGFICDLEQDEVPMIADLAKEPWKIESRMMLEVTVHRGEREVYHALALNEAVINKGAVSQVLNLGTSINGEHMFDLKGDGLIVATATGSTGYSRSAGGPVMSPNIRGIIITTLCAMNLTVGSWILQAEDVVTVSTLEKGHMSGFLSVDGGRAFSLRKGDRIEVRRSGYETQLLRLKNRGFFDEYDRKMGIGGFRNEK